MYRKTALLVTLFAALAGCATPPKQAGIDAVDALVAAQLRPGIEPPTGERDARALAARVDALLAQALTLERAVSVALLNNPRVLAEYAQLGVSRGDLIDASRLPNPRFGWLREDEGDSNIYTQSLSQEFAAALLLPARTRISEAEYARVQQAIADAVIDLAADVEVAWFEALAAQQVAAMRAAVAKAAGLAAELAGRFHAAGNLPRLELALEQAAASTAAIESRRAAAQARSARSGLATLLGVRSSVSLELPASLAAPPPGRYIEARLIARAAQERLDLAAAIRERQMRADTLDLAQSWRWLGSLELGVERETEDGDVRVRGLEASIELPIFQQGQAAIARAEGELAAADARLAQLRLAIDNEIALAVERVEVERQIAEDYRTLLLPQREAIVDGTQREVNFMFESAFELLRVKQEQYAAYQEYIEAVRDYWIARVELRRAVGGPLPDDDDEFEPTIGVEAIVPNPNQTPDANAHDHHNHD
ncbi:MAG TPA: TolC family protein [Xanthomonadales bacterium]|nr:TolC family protein [Xanthomonadales bacterium]